MGTTLGRPSRRSAGARTVLGLVLAVAVMAGAIRPASADALGGATETVAAPPDRTPPDTGKPDELDGLQHGDPAAGIGLMDPPASDSYGEAQLRYPIDIPPGRLGWQPQVGLAYGSGGDNGWMGLGWDVSLDAIKVPGLGSDVSADSVEVDTRWGVPRYDGAYESETYLFGGEQLSPNAHHSDLIRRDAQDGDRRVFTKRVEGDYLYIIRHGTDPTNYWWEVHDKLGNKYFYGGAIDEKFTRENDGALNQGPEQGHVVPEATLADDAGNIYWWGLREKWDISTNVVTYFYDKESDSGVGDGTTGPKGAQAYLDHINYSGSKLRYDSTYGLTDDDNKPKAQDPLPRWGRYDVRFVRNTQLGEPRRPDVTIDASHGALEVTAELLRQIEVTYCPHERGKPSAHATTYPSYQDCADRQLVRRYDMNYQTGPFAKTLLHSIDQTDSAGKVVASHTMDYFDDVRDGDKYKGFDESGSSGYQTWNTHLDNTNETILGTEHSSALGSAKTTSGDGRLFLGFNPVSPDKNIAIGGGIQLGGSDGESSLELLDINGDGLPDEVYKSGGDVYFKLNKSGPDGQPTFDDHATKIANLGSLPQNSTFSVGAGFEAYLGASIMYNHSWTWAKEPAYFADVNADGLPDFVDHGTVLFNHRDPATGDISFGTDSAGTEVVIQTPHFSDADNVLGDRSGVEARERSQFPLQDTVRRWVAPFGGDVRITAPVNLQQASPDGVRVAVQRNGGELWHADIPGGDQEIRTPGGDEGLGLHVERGDRVYFRVQSVDNGAGDRVAWDPIVQYEGKAPALDANGQDAYRYEASEDFTLAGRPGIFTVMPIDGHVKVTGKVHKARATTDDVRVLVDHDGTTVASIPIASDFVGDTPVSAEFDVRGPRPDPNDAKNVVTDKVTLRLAVDSHIDVTALSWSDDSGTAGPPMYYTSGTQPNGQPVTTQDDKGKYIIQLHPLYDIDFYAGSNLDGPQGSKTLFEDNGNDDHAEAEDVDVKAHIWIPDTIPPDLLPASVVFTMKGRAGLVHKSTRALPQPVTVQNRELFTDDIGFTAHVTENEPYWFDLTTTDPRLAPYLHLDVDSGSGDDLPTAIRWPSVPVNDDQSDVFPQAFRGWAYAGYNGDGDRAGQPLNEADFKFHKGDYPQGEDDKPTGFDPGAGEPPPGSTTDGGFKDPKKAKSYPYAPDPDKNRWRGPKEANADAKVVGETFGGAAESSASRLGPDDVRVPGAAELMPSGASAPVRLGSSEEDQLGVGLGVSGSTSTGTSVGDLDYVDMNGDGYPDVVGSGDIIYTNQTGSRDLRKSVGPDPVRSDHEFALGVGGGGSPVSVKKSPSGDGNTQKQAGGGPKIGSHRKPSGTKGSSKYSRAAKSVVRAPSKAANAVKGAAAKAAKSAATKAANAAKAAAKAAVTKGASAKAGKGSSSKTKSANKGGKKSANKGGKKSGNKKANGKAGKFTTARKAISKAAPSFDIGGSDNDTWTNTPGQLGDAGSVDEHDLADMNGDGLPDKVEADGHTLKVWWNLGYRFASEPVEWPGGDFLEQGSSDGRDLDLGLGFNIGKFEFAGGVSVSQDDERSDITWTDVNGDGLPDRVSRQSGGVRVAFNTGGGLFTPPATDGENNWGHFMTGNIASSESVGLGGGADLTIPIGPLCPPWAVRLCWIIINPGAHVDTSVTATRIGLVDVNGDGAPDSVSSDDDGGINVRLNRTGRTNLLKAVHRPLGASFSLDYQRYGNTPSKPDSEWLLSKVSVDDGHRGDGADVQTKTYQYEDGRFSFAEREDYGYHKVVESDLDQNGNAYRSYERTYSTNSYYSRGLLLNETLREGNAPKMSTVNTYDVVDSKTGVTLDQQGLESTTGSAFPRLVKVEQLWNDAAANVAKQTEMDYQYDLRGNLIKVVDRGEPDTTSDDVSAEMAYTVCGGIRSDDPTGDYPWTQTAWKLWVKSGDTWLQRREANMECNTASVSEVRDYLNPSGDDPDNVAVTTVVYVDVGGQVKQVIGPGKRPAGGVDTRYGVSYEYDEVGADPVRTTDSFGLESRASYDNRLGVLTSVTDPNHAVTSYGYDTRGRVTSVRGPLQQDPNGPATVSFEYHDDAPDPWALARHVDTARPGTTIDTVQFVDGLDRTIQTKQDATVFAGVDKPAQDVMVVSGPIVYDAFGREVQEFLPTTEPTGTPGSFNTDRDANSTTSKYDALDRVTEVTEPGPRTTKYSYGFGPLQGRPMFSSIQTDPMGSRTRTFTDVRDDVVGIEKLGRTTSPTSVLTKYDYDPLQRLVQVTDAGQKVTRVGYDLMGRRTSVDNPDTGKVESRYDLASNLVGELTPNLRAAGRQTTYEWDRNRLTAVRYPLNPSNNVAYRYGPPGAPDYGAGRVVSVDDGSRTQTRAYDPTGEVARETTLMKVHNLSPTTAPAHTYTTSFVYDTWGRPLTMTYPDGELATYSYDSGGNPRALSGQKAGITYNYVDRREYDKFGKEQLLAYGNGVNTQKSYEPTTQWLSKQAVTNGTSKLQDLAYSYDKMGNTLQRQDSRPLPTSDLMGGPSTQTFTYDDLYRVTSAKGTYKYPPDKQRDYASVLTYDGAGRVSKKTQTDKINGKEQKGTTYNLGYDYKAAQPHAPSHIGRQTNGWDADGNFTGWTDDQSGAKRLVNWDEEDRVKSISDSGSTTEYQYTDEDVLGIERGPQSEVEYVNEFYTAMSGGVTWKNFLMDDAVLVTKRAYFDGKPEDLRYYLTSDLTDSINIVTDAGGKLFEHLEYFPGGEIWVREHSETFREPYLFEGNYFEEIRKLNRMGVRWYEPQAGFLYSADPTITDQVDSVVDEPRLLAPYTYAYDNPTGYVDDTGLSGVWVHASPTQKAPGPLHSRVRAKVKSFVQDPEFGENVSGKFEVPSLVEIDVNGDGTLGLGLSVLGVDVKHLKHLRKLIKP